MGGNIVYSRNWKKMSVARTQRICMCWRVGHGPKCSQRSEQHHARQAIGRHTKRSSVSPRGSNLPLEL